MTKIIVVGHGGYGTAVKNNLGMIVGETEGFLYVDFDLTDDINILEDKLKVAVKSCGDDEILFACDIAGGSPFRQSAMLCVEEPRYRAVAGLNTAAFAEMVYNLELSADELANMAVDVTKSSVMRFPEQNQ